jgi:hypothetical protein
MSLRQFTSTDGTTWEVYDVVAQEDSEDASPSRSFSPPSGSFRRYSAWLCFESHEEKRRLTPIPDDWQKASEEELLQLLVLAEPATKTRRE